MKTGTLDSISIRILYPDDRNVSAAQLVSWAMDAFDNKQISAKPTTLAEAIASLEDAGLVTYHQNIDSLLDLPIAYELLDAK